MPERRIAEPPVIELDAWPQLPPAISTYARRIAKYFTGQPVSVGVEIITGTPNYYRVWRSETRNGQRFYEVQLDTRPAP